MSARSKSSIVFVHGVWADGSSFSKLIPALQMEGHEVMAAQYGLDSRLAVVLHRMWVGGSEFRWNKHSAATPTVA